jgi:hypothetical protein
VVFLWVSLVQVVLLSPPPPPGVCK